MVISSMREAQTSQKKFSVYMIVDEGLDTW